MGDHEELLKEIVKKLTPQILQAQVLGEIDLGDVVFVWRLKLKDK